MSTSHINLKAACPALRMSKRDVHPSAAHDRSFLSMINVIGGGMMFDWEGRRLAPVGHTAEALTRSRR
jgi:hypothetical protein